MEVPPRSPTGPPVEDDGLASQDNPPPTDAAELHIALIPCDQPDSAPARPHDGAGSTEVRLLTKSQQPRSDRRRASQLPGCLATTLARLAAAVRRQLASGRWKVPVLPGRGGRAPSAK